MLNAAATRSINVLRNTNRTEQRLFCPAYYKLRRIETENGTVVIDQIQFVLLIYAE